MSKGDETRQAILSTAIELASRTGLSGLTIGELASRTGLSKSGLFAHFGSKDQLQLETLKGAADLFANTVVAPALTQQSGLPRIRALFENWMTWAGTEVGGAGCIFVAATVEWDDREGPVRDYIVWVQGEWLKVLARAGERAVSQGAFRHDLDTRQFANDLYSAMLGFHHASRLVRDPKASARAWDLFDRIVLDAEKSTNVRL